MREEADGASLAAQIVSMRSRFQMSQVANSNTKRSLLKLVTALLAYTTPASGLPARPNSSVAL